MPKVTINYNNKVIKNLRHMEPLEIGRIVSDCALQGRIVMRTANSEDIEIMDLTCLEEDSCWTWKDDLDDIKVEIDPNPELIINLSI